MKVCNGGMVESGCDVDGALFHGGNRKKILHTYRYVTYVSLSALRNMDRQFLMGIPGHCCPHVCQDQF